ncbi:MAG TPA: tetratricopeptide repeat protein [Vicinamibacterales bacterium]
MFAALLFGVALTTAGVQEPSAQQLFERGNLDAAVSRVQEQGEAAPPDQVYLQALAHRKASRNEEAKAAFNRLAAAGDNAWGAIGRSGVALIDGNLDAALQEAQQAVQKEDGNAHARYQLGLVHAARGEHAPAAEAFAQAAERNPSFAYAHYNAGMQFYEAKRIDRMAVFFENFLKLAPEAPERGAVESIMRTVRGR